jgi:hypothetical protein
MEGFVVEACLCLTPATSGARIARSGRIRAVPGDAAERNVLGRCTVLTFSRFVSSVAFLSAVVAPAHESAAQLLGVGWLDASLYDVNPATGAASNPRSTGRQRLGGITISREGILYVLSIELTGPPAGASLYTVDQNTGSTQRVGSLVAGFPEGDIDFDPTSGLLYGVTRGGGGSNLYRIDAQTAQLTLIGTISGQLDSSAMAFDHAGTLYILNTGQPVNESLLTVDVTTGQILQSVPLNLNLGSVAGMDFDRSTGILYVCDGFQDGTDTLYTLDPATGVLSPVGSTGLADGLAGLTFLCPPGITGRVVFEDDATPVIGAQVVIQGLVELYTADVDASGHYSFRADQIPPFNPLGYTVFARYRIPAEFTFPHPGGTYQEVAVQPYDLDTAADLTISLSGELSRTRFDFVFPWPVILLHGIMKFPNSGFGPDHFNHLQPYLANPVTLQSVRRGFIPLVPDMGSARVGADQHLSRSVNEYYAAVLPRVRRIFRLFPPQTKFSFVCYSQGGLVARQLLDAAVGNVVAAEHFAKIIQFGTPNAGSCFGGVACATFTHFCPLSVARMIDFNFGDGMTLVPHNYIGPRQSLPGSQVPFYLIAGGRFRRIDLTRLGYAINNFCLEDPGNAPMGSDSVTPVHSVFVLSSLGYNASQARMVTLPHEDHLSLPDSQDVIDQVYGWLLEGTPLQ